MKKLVLILTVVLMICSVATFSFASGGQHQGEKGQGEVVQKQIRNNK